MGIDGVRGKEDAGVTVPFNKGSDLSGTLDKGAFVHLVYPFYYETRPSELTKIKIERAGKTSTHAWSEEPNFRIEDPVSHIESQLPQEAGARAKAPLVRSWLLSNSAQNVLTKNNHSEWCASTDKEATFTFRIIEPVRLDWFRSGVAFMTFTLSDVQKASDRHADNSMTAGDWMDFVACIREDNRKGYETLCIWKTPDGIPSEQLYDLQKKYSKTRNDLLSLTEDRLKVGYSLSDVRDKLLTDIRTILRTKAGAGERDVERAFSARRFITYSYIKIREVDKSDETTLLYALSNGFHSGQLLIPTTSQLQQAEPYRFEYAKSHWMLSSLERFSFVDAGDVTSNDDPFFATELPSHIESQYFSLYLLALQERFALLSLSQKIANEALKLDLSDSVEGDINRLVEYRKALSTLRQQVLAFHVGSLFRHVSHKEHHQAYFRRWCEVLDIEALVDEVRVEYDELEAFVEAKTREAQINTEKESARDQQWFGFFVAALALPALALTYMQVVIQTGTPEAKHYAPIVVGAMFIVAMVLGVGYPQYRRRVKHKNVKSVMFNVLGGNTRTDDVANCTVTTTKANAPLEAHAVMSEYPHNGR